MANQEVSHGGDVHGEFDVRVFVDCYEAIADTFIDTRGAATSLMRLISKDDSIFELGLGTGYFAQFLHKDGYNISGIQPADGMLARLKEEYPDIPVVAEAYVQDYDFDNKYDAIVSHSSVFLFTRPDPQLANSIGTDLIFQSFIQDKDLTFESVDKVMRALNPGGRLFINIQPNAHQYAQVNDNLSFEMLSCDYDFDQSHVSKVFGITSNGIRKVLDPDVSFVLKRDDFDASIQHRGYRYDVSEDGYWVSLKNQAQSIVS